MKRGKRGSLGEVGRAWTYLLRLATRGFLGELSLGALNVGKRVGRRLRLAVRLIAPRAAGVGKRTSHRKAKMKTATATPTPSLGTPLPPYSPPESASSDRRPPPPPR